MGKGKTTRRWKKTDPFHHIHPLMRPGQGHGNSREGENPRTIAPCKNVNRETTNHIRTEMPRSAPKLLNLRTNIRLEVSVLLPKVHIYIRRAKIWPLEPHVQNTFRTEAAKYRLDGAKSIIELMFDTYGTSVLY